MKLFFQKFYQSPAKNYFYPMKRIWKVLLGIAAVLLLTVVMAMILAPGYIKDYIEEHDLELVGREITLDKIHIGWFSGRLGIDNLVMHEKDSSEIFISIENIDTQIAIGQLFKSHIHIPHFTIAGLQVQINQEGDHFNFDDLATAETDSSSAPAETENEWRFTLENLLIHQSTLNYHSDIAPEIKADSLRFFVPAITHDMQHMDVALSFLLGSGGKITTNTHLDLAGESYQVNFKSDSVSLTLVEPYFAEAIKLSAVKGSLNTNLNIMGSWADTEVLNLSGNIDVNGFAMVDPRGDNLVACKKLDIEVDSIRMKDAVYNIGHIKAAGLYAIYEMYDESDNFSRLLVADTTAVTNSEGEVELDYSNPFLVLAYYIQDLAKSYNESIYRIGTFDISESHIQFNDYTPTDPFRYSLTEFRIHADSLSSTRETIEISMGSVLNNAGVFEGTIVAFTANPADMDIDYTIKGTGLTPFAPYTSLYISYPITRGELLYECNTRIRDGKIVSSNNMVIKDFTFGNKSDDKAFYDMPVKLAVSILKDLNGEIHIDLPIEGDLKDPNYKLSKVIWNTLKNILLKAVTAPYRILARAFQVDEENLKQLHFNLLERELNKEHQNQLNDLFKALDSKPELNVEFKRLTGKYEEAERYAITQSERRFLFGDSAPEELSNDQTKLLREHDIKDSLFVAWLDTHIAPPDRDLPVQRKCVLYIGEETAMAAVDNIGARRSESIRSYLTENKSLQPDRIRFMIVPNDSLITSRSTAIYSIGFWVDEE
jgi:hypothetical protein